MSKYAENYKLIDWSRELPAVERKQHSLRPNGNVISDSMPAMIHPITGKLMDSKSKFRAVTRMHGCVEVGNEKQVDRRSIDMGDCKRDIARAIEQLGG